MFFIETARPEIEEDEIFEYSYGNFLITEANSNAKAADTFIMKNNLYPRVEAVLNTPVGDRRFKELVGRYIDRNNEKLYTSGPVYLIPFGDRDKADFFRHFKIDPREIRTWVDEVIATLGSQSDFKLLRGNPIFWMFYMCIRYYTLKKDKKGINASLAIYALADYPSIFSRFFKYGANPGVMQYTIDQLTEKYIIKQAGHIFGALMLSIQHSYDFLNPYMEYASDKEVIRWIQRIRNDQKSMIKKICDQYMKNHAKGLRVRSTRQSNSDIPIDDEFSNKSSDVENVSNKICLKIFTDGVDLTYASICARMAQVSVVDTRFYLTKIVTDKYSDEIQKFVSSILFIYLYDENHEINEINSKQFLLWAEELFRKTNSNNPNIKNIKDTLEKWAKETGVHDKFKRLASRVNYKKAIFFYFILMIQKNN